MATTPNFSWPTPDNTDLVKNGALAIRTLGDAIDASLVDLEGGTTDQVLAKNSNTDMDFKWVTSDDANAIQNAIVDAKGDLIAASANDTPARLAVGANDLLLTAASGEATGLKYTGGWTTWTPSYVRLTIGNGTVTARYQQIGKTVNFIWQLVWGSTTSTTNYPYITFPITPSLVNTYQNIGFSQLIDTSTGAIYFGSVQSESTGGFTPFNQKTDATYLYQGIVDSGTPVTWTTNDVWVLYGSYEVA